jgi:Flp pilus assembly protein TadG
MLEFALVLPLLALLAFGTAEMGLAWTAHNRIEGATSAAARVGSSTGQDVNADVSILVALRAALPAEALANLDRVVIFKPVNADGGMPATATCVRPVGSTSQVGSAGNCNTYTGATVRAVTTATDLGPADDSWNGLTRKDGLADAGGPDYLGVYVRTRQDSKTSFFGDFTITRTSIYRLQPDIDG